MPVCVNQDQSIIDFQNPNIQEFSEGSNIFFSKCVKCYDLKKAENSDRE